MTQTNELVANETRAHAGALAVFGRETGIDVRGPEYQRMLVQAVKLSLSKPGRDGIWKTVVPTYANSYRATDADLAYWLRDMAPGDVAVYLERLIGLEWFDEFGKPQEPLTEARARAIWDCYQRETQSLALAIVEPKIERTPIEWADDGVIDAAEFAHMTFAAAEPEPAELILRPMTIEESAAVQASNQADMLAAIAESTPSTHWTELANQYEKVKREATKLRREGWAMVADGMDAKAAQLLSDMQAARAAAIGA